MGAEGLKMRPRAEGWSGLMTLEPNAPVLGCPKADVDPKADWTGAAAVEDEAPKAEGVEGCGAPKADVPNADVGAAVGAAFGAPNADVVVGALPLPNDG